MRIVSKISMILVVSMTVFWGLNNHPAYAKSKYPDLPKFSDIKDLSSKSRQIYLKHLAKLSTQPENKFFLKYLIVKDQKKKRICLPIVFGPDSRPRAMEKKGKRTIECPQNVKKAASLFDDIKMSPGWMKLKSQLRIHCLDQLYCKKFYGSQGVLFSRLKKASKRKPKTSRVKKRAKAKKK